MCALGVYTAAVLWLNSDLTVTLGLGGVSGTDRQVAHDVIMHTWGCIGL